MGVEVKAVGRVQAWAAPTRVGTPRFDIAAKRSWDSSTNKMATTAGRPAAVWVFAECTPTIAKSSLVADPDQWRFHVISTSSLDEHRPTQKSISISEVARLVPSVAFDDLRAAVDAVVNGP